MANYWAQFKLVNNHLFRFDTRVYLSDVASCSYDDPIVGAIVAKNPGSSRPSDPTSANLQVVSLNGGRLLPTVRGVVAKSYLRARKTWPSRAYIQVFNLFYLCDMQAKRALRAQLLLTHLKCKNESKSTPWLWYAWGRMGNKVPDLAARFADLQSANRFYFDKETCEMHFGHPSDDAFPKHPQGCRQDPIVEHISKLIITCRL